MAEPRLTGRGSFRRVFEVTLPDAIDMDRRGLLPPTPTERVLPKEGEREMTPADLFGCRFLVALDHIGVSGFAMFRVAYDMAYGRDVVEVNGLRGRRVGCGRLIGAIKEIARDLGLVIAFDVEIPNVRMRLAMEKSGAVFHRVRGTLVP